MRVRIPTWVPACERFLRWRGLRGLSEMFQSCLPTLFVECQEIGLGARANVGFMAGVVEGTDGQVRQALVRDSVISQAAGDAEAVDHAFDLGVGFGGRFLFGRGAIAIE